MNLDDDLTLAEFQEAVYALAKEQGFYEGETPLVDNFKHLAGEVIEAAFARADAFASYDEVGLEFADIMILALSMAAHMGINMEDFLKRKHEINKSRGHLHEEKSKIKEMTDKNGLSEPFLTKAKSATFTERETFLCAKEMATNLKKTSKRLGISRGDLIRHFIKEGLNLINKKN